MSLKIAFMAGCACFVTLSGFGCGFQWMPPGSYFEGCDAQGYVLLTEKLADLTIPGEEGSFPIYAFFNSEYATPSPYAGSWRIGILDISLVQVSENQFRMQDPGGNGTLLTRNAKDKTVLEGAGWKGTITASRTKLWASCGWSVEFERGRISKITTAHDKTLVFNYAEGYVSGITCDGKPLITVGSLKGDTVDIAINGKKFGIVRADQPNIQYVDKANMQRGTWKSLSRITGQGDGDGSPSYTYTVDEKLQPVMLVEGKNQDPFKIVWNPQTRKILRYKDWQYTKTRDRKNDWDTIELTRKNSKGEVESYFRDIGAGVRITQQGTSKRSEYHFTSGPAAGKIRKIEDMLDGKVTNLQQYFYDEKGRMIRGKENEDILTFRYDDKSRTATAKKNDALLWKKYMDEKDRVIKVEYPDGKDLRITHHEKRPSEAELVYGKVSVSVQLNDEGWIKDGTEVFKGLF